jgi:hypothetical protein
MISATFLSSQKIFRIRLIVSKARFFLHNCKKIEFYGNVAIEYYIIGNVKAIVTISCLT